MAVHTRNNEPASNDVTTSLDDLPRENVKVILQFLGNVPDFLHCEQSYPVFFHALSDDELWRSLSGCDGKPDPRLKTHRQQACVERNLNHVRRQQSSSFNLFVQAFPKSKSCAEWKAVFHTLLRRHKPSSIVPGTLHHYALRGDTMGTLVEELQAFLLSRWERAMTLCIELCSEKDYPTLSKLHLIQQERLLPEPDCRARLFVEGSYLPSELKKANTLHPEHENIQFSKAFDKIIRSTAFRAGIVKIENEAVDVMKVAVVRFLKKILMVVAEDLHISFYYQRRDQQLSKWDRKKRELFLDDRIRDICPYAAEQCMSSVGLSGETASVTAFIHTPVPRQIEKAVSRVLPAFPSKVYNLWFVDGIWSQDLEDREIAAAESCYCWTREPSLVDVEREVFDNFPSHTVMVRGIVRAVEPPRHFSVDLGSEVDYEDEEDSFSVYTDSASSVSSDEEDEEI